MLKQTKPTYADYLASLNQKTDKPHKKQWAGFWMAIFSIFIMIAPSLIGPKYLSPFWAIMIILVGGVGLYAGMTFVEGQMVDENYICERYRASGSVKIVAQLNALPKQTVLEILHRHGYANGAETGKAISKRAKITEAQRNRIASMHAAKITNKDIAARLGISKVTVTRHLAEFYNPEQLARIKARERKNNQKYRKKKAEEKLIEMGADNN